jgi:hypothetical protein
MKKNVSIALLSGVVALGIAGFGIAEHLVNEELRRNFDKELAKLEDQVAITYDRFHYSLLSRQATARGLTATTADGKYRVLVEQLKLQRMERDKTLDLVTALRLAGGGVRLREKKGDGYVPALTGLGYNDPKLSFRLDQTYDPATETLTVNEIGLTGAEMGELHLKARFSGLRKINTEGFTSGNILKIAAGVGNLQFHGASLDYIDTGLAEKILRRRETGQKISRAEIVAGVAKGMRAQKFFRFSEEMIAEFSAFLEKPGRLRMDSAPGQPVGSALIGTTLLFRGNLLQVLGVTIRNGAPG